MEKDNKKLDSKSAKAKTGTGKEAKPEPKSDKNEKKDDKKVVSEVGAKARFIKVSPRKVRLVISQLSGMETEKALDYLQFINKAAVRPVIKLIKSAIANAENNFKLDKKDLYIKKITADDGPTLKRWKPRAYGRSAPIRKRTSHINLILGVKAGAKLKTVTKKEEKKVEAKKEEVKVVKPEEIKKEALKTRSIGPAEKGKDEKGFLKGIFRRKTG